MSVAVRVSGEPAAPGQFAVPSASRPGETWAVFWRTADVCFCACPGFTHRRTCCHVEQVAFAIELEARDARANSTPTSRIDAAARLQSIEELFSA